MDNRRDPGTGDAGRYVSGARAEADAATVVALQPVGGNERGNQARVFLVMLAATAVLAFAAGAAVNRPAVPSASASATVAARVQGSLAPGGSALATSLLPTTSPTPSSGAQTPAPSNRSPWAWVRGTLPDANLNPFGIWGVGRSIVMLANANQHWILPSLAPGRGWQVAQPPPAIDRYLGGSVIDRRLWFLARVTGIQDDDATWQLLSTDGKSWDSLGPAKGLGAIDFVPFLARVAGTWVAAPAAYTPNGAGDSRQSLRWSADGRQWQPAVVPELPADTMFERGAATRDVMVMLGQGGPPDAAQYVILRSTDGRTWRRSPFPESLDAPLDLACNERACVLTGFEIGSSAMPLSWSSTDGRTWTESTTVVSNDGAQAGLRKVLPIDGGFLGMADEPFAWLSIDDGRTWGMLEVLPDGQAGSLQDLAVAGDIVIALGLDQENGAFVVWRGSLDRMKDALR